MAAGGGIPRSVARAILERMFYTGRGANELLTEMGGGYMDAPQLAKVMLSLVRDNPQAVADYKSGRKQALSFLTGQVMRQAQGRADPQVVKRVLEEYLGG